MPAIRLVRLLLLLVAGVHTLSLIANFMWRVLELRHPIPRFGWLVSFLNVDAENNLPTWLASAVLLLTAYVLWEVATAAKAAGARYVPHWRMLSLVFVFLSLDEGAQVHEVANRSDVVDLGAASYLSWIAVAAPFVLVFAVAYVRFLVHLPARTRWLMVAGGAVFLTGAVGLEIIGALVGSDQLGGVEAGFASMQYSLFAAAEELMEIGGNIIFLYAAAAYLQQHLQASEGQASEGQASEGVRRGTPAQPAERVLPSRRRAGL